MSRERRTLTMSAVAPWPTISSSLNSGSEGEESGVEAEVRRAAEVGGKGESGCGQPVCVCVCVMCVWGWLMRVCASCVCA